MEMDIKSFLGGAGRTEVIYRVCNTRVKGAAAPS